MNLTSHLPHSPDHQGAKAADDFSFNAEYWLN